jgi:uncharacterized protein (TIGR03089 family)
VPPEFPVPDTIPRLLGHHVRADPATPAVTWLDPAEGARVELSRVTLANWVAKIGGLLQDVVEVDAGERVHLRLPAHWLAVAWPLACWSVGAEVLPGDDTVGRGDRSHRYAGADVEVTGDDAEPPPGDRVVVVGLSPLGGRSRRAVPAGTLDAGAEVLGQPDHLVAYSAPTRASAATPGHDHAALIDAARARAADLGLRPGCRLATDVGPCTTAGLVETVLVPLVTGGSLVLLATGTARGSATGLTAERPDALAGSLRG